MENKANYSIEREAEHFVLIRDVGPHNKFKTITNAPDSVLDELTENEKIDGRRLFYYDSDGYLAEIVRWRGAVEILAVSDAERRYFDL